MQGSRYNEAFRSKNQFLAFLGILSIVLTYLSILSYDIFKHFITIEKILHVLLFPISSLFQFFDVASLCLFCHSSPNFLAESGTFCLVQIAW